MRQCGLYCCFMRTGWWILKMRNHPSYPWFKSAGACVLVIYWIIFSGESFRAIFIAPACLRSRRKMENGLIYDYVKPNTDGIRSDVYGQNFPTYSLISGIRTWFKTLYCPSKQLKYWMIKIKWWPDAVVDFYQMVYQLNKQSLKKIKKGMIRQYIQYTSVWSW